MKALSAVWAVVCVVGLVFFGCSDARVGQEYANAIGSYWTLADRASSLELKAEYLDRFVAAVDSAHLTGHDAIVYPTVQNDVRPNIEALKSLQTRLHQIRQMDVQSFQYQQAITQITAQEQGEAGPMLGVIEGVWVKQNHPFFWSWVAGVVYAFLIVTGVVAIAVFLSIALEDY